MMWIAIVAFATLFGVGAYNISAHHAELVNQNKVLQQQVMMLRTQQVPSVASLDGVQITNLDNERHEL